MFIYLFTYLFIYLFNYLFIRKLNLLKVMLLDWVIKLKRSISLKRRFSMSVTWNILCIRPCSVNLMFITLLKNQVECIFLALLSCRHLYASC